MPSRTLHFFLVRHGETNSNRELIIHGQTDVPLNELGRVQAGKAAEALKDVTFSKVWASDLERAYETAAIIARGNSTLSGLKTEEILLKRPLARERHFGSMEGETFQVYGEGMKAAGAKTFWAFTPEGGETMGDVRERAKKLTVDTLSEMKEHLLKTDEDHVTKVLLVSHGGFIKEFIAHFVDRWPGLLKMAENWRDKIPQNTSVSEFKFAVNIDESKDVTDSITAVECLRLFDDGHLEGLGNIDFNKARKLLK